MVLFIFRIIFILYILFLFTLLVWCKRKEGDILDTGHGEARVEQFLGQGYSGRVYKVLYLPTEEVCAIKELKIKINDARFDARIQRAESEIKIHEEFREVPHVIRYIACHKYESKGFVYYNVLLEFAEGGDLFDFMVALIDNVKSLSEAQVALYMFQILKGVEEMHNRNYVHGDLKMENVLLAGQKTILQPYLMIADFDQAFDVTKVKGGKIVGKSGSPTYMSPQVIREEPYAMDADMWAVGVIAYALLYRYKPFADDNETLAGNLKFGKIHGQNQRASEGFITFVTGLLDPNPETRFTVKQALEDKWLLQYVNDRMNVINLFRPDGDHYTDGKTRIPRAKKKDSSILAPLFKRIKNIVNL